MPGHPPDPLIELVSIHWERVQLIIEGRLLSDEVDPSVLRLVHVDDGRIAAPTRATISDGRVSVRFDVMTGPDRQPLAPGRWRLAARVTTGVGAADGFEAPAKVFPLAKAIYGVTPVLDPASGTLSLDVGLDVSGEERGPVIRPRRIRRAAFALVASIARRWRRGKRRRVLFASRLISEMSGNLQVVHDRMIERGLDGELDILTMLKPGITDRWPVRDRFRLARELVTSDVILVDDVFPPLNWAQPGPDVRIIQLWHASGAFKTIGYSRAGKPGGPNPFGTIHRNYTAAIVSSDHDVPFYAEAFGIPEANVVPTGIPRMDRYFDPQRRVSGAAAARAAFPQIDGRYTILFAPTYRGETFRDAFYGFEHLDYAALHALCVERDAVVVIKMHPFVQERPNIPEAFRDRLIDGSGASIDVNDLLFAVDLLVTDYSSIVFEFSVFGRPMLFFAYDLEDYVATRDFYVPFEAFVPGRIVRTFDAMLDAIRRDDFEVEKVDAFAHRHFAHLDGGSTDRVIDELILAP
jgi:CDP-ribitol ribitolphosphotransferase / teichoic acid ribitol-phosphate polymerase